MTSFHHRLMKTYAALHRQIMVQAQQEGLTAGQPKILEYLLEHEGTDQCGIARHCEIEAATVGSILSRMETAGLIERRRREDNRRSLCVYLTQSGRAAANRVIEIFAEAERRAFLHCDEESKAQLAEILEKLYENLTEQEKRK